MVNQSGGDLAIGAVVKDCCSGVLVLVVSGSSVAVVAAAGAEP